MTSSLSFAEDSPIGVWRTYDDSDGQAASLVQIEEKNGLIEGRIVKLLPRKGHDVNAVCDKCEGENKNQPITGMKILWNMKRDGDKYVGGEIFDPNSANTYRCKMHVVDGKLEVRGYLGVSLFGRSQTWLREQ
jgi:uncharacterized protein (DUF2147 family)